MSKIQWRGGALLAPLPAVMVTCGNMEKANIVTVAWTGILNTIPPKSYIALRPSRYSYDIIKENREFAIHLTTVSMAKSADYCGMVTGRKVDKFKKCNFHKEQATQISVPLIAEAPLSLECKVTDIIPLGSHDMFLCDIVAVNVEETLVDKNGRLNIEKANLAAFAHGEYFELGKKIGNFGYSMKKKKKHKPIKK